MAKIEKEFSDKIYNRYLELRAQSKFKKGIIQEILRREFGLKRTTAFDHSVGRFRGQVEFKEKEPKVIEKPRVLSMPSTEYKKADKHKTYIITGWEIRVQPNEKFIDCLNQLAEYHDAKKLLVPVWFEDVDYIPNILKENFDILTDNRRFNDNLIFHYVPTHALAISPLTGWRGVFHSDTAIIPGLVQEMITEPSKAECKRLLTTGSVGYLNASFDQYDSIDNQNDTYQNLKRRWNSVTRKSAGRSTALAQKITKPCALIVELINGKHFITRYVTMHEDGVLYDLDKKFTAGSKSPEDSKPLSLTCSDYHVWEMEPASHKSTMDQIKTLEPEYVLLNDFMDCASTNHHEVGSAYKFNNAPSIDEEARVTREVLDEICKISDKVIWLQSNHENFINKLLDMPENVWRLNGNYATLCELQSYRLKTERHPVIKLLGLDDIDNLTFLDEKDFFVLKDTTFIHGHNSFRPTSFPGLAKLYGNLVTGHFHNPQIIRGNAFCVGSNAKRDLNYSIGLSASMSTNAIQHHDGSIQMIDTVNGIWRKK